ncbi:MAG: cell wall-active antibiotics response protein [Marinilabiliaceae bacterium]|nr:cell wall-active antibiotics response protein [Marinilabiliaceae bacterium]
MKKVKCRTKIDLVCFALLSIALGLIFVGRNMGIISESLFSVLISWQMLMVVIGLYSISHRGYLWGMFIMGIGLFFLIPIITGAGKDWVSIYWPLIFVFVGILAIVKILMPRNKRKCEHSRCNEHYFSKEDCRTENGFVYSHNSFSATKHIVMDEIFKGAEITNHFGATELDLRRTKLQEGDTFIDIESRCGGIEIRLPDNWLVLTELNSFMSGVDDQRPKSADKIDECCRLILRGKLSLSGIELKN